MQDFLKAKKIIENRKKKAEEEHSKKMNKLMENEEFFSAHSRVSYLKFELAKREVYNLPIDEELTKEYEEKSKIIAEKMSKCGIGEYPDYFCPKCGDTGYINGKICDCLEKARQELVVSEYGFLRNMPDSLTNIDLDFYGKEKENYQKRIRFLESNFVCGNLNFCTVIGATGTGKTHLAYTVMKEALLAGKSIKIINSVRLNREFLNYHCAPLADKNAVWEEIADYDYMLIDDLGVESDINNVTLQYLYELLTERAEKKTLITANLSVKHLEDKYGQRILSRLSDKVKSAIIEVTGKDYRQK